MNKHWLLQPGKIHKLFADGHALGKTVEGSGLDDIAVDSGIYSAATIRAILAGKNYTRFVEFHIMYAFAIISLKFEAAFGDGIPNAIADQARAFREALHEETNEMIEIYDDLANHYTSEIKPKITTENTGLPKFLDNLLEQIEVMLTCIAAIHSRDLEATLTAMDRGVKYYAAHDLPNYFQLIPVYLAEMLEVKKNDPVTWKYLQNDFVVTNSTLALVNLFDDQGLEQKIKELKKYGALTGITQDEEAFDRFVATAPRLASMVEKFLITYPKVRKSAEKEVYHQLQDNTGLRCALNSIVIRNCIVTHCKGNPYILKTPLCHVTSAALIPEPAASDILNYPEKGQKRYEWLVETRLLEGSPECIWDPLPQAKIKRFANWMPKTTVKVNNKLYKVRHNRQFQSKCLLVAKSRPELLVKLPYLMGKYEMSVYPCSLFTSDGKLIIDKGKAKLMTQIIQKKPQKTIDNKIEEKKKVIIIDAVCEVRALKKHPDTTKMSHLKELFIQRIRIKIDPYDESHLLFDTYHELYDFSLKDGARDDRAQNALGTISTVDYEEIHDEMSIKKTRGP